MADKYGQGAMYIQEQVAWKAGRYSALLCTTVGLYLPVCQQLWKTPKTNMPSLNTDVVNVFPYGAFLGLWYVLHVWSFQ